MPLVIIFSPNPLYPWIETLYYFIEYTVDHQHRRTSDWQYWKTNGKGGYYIILPREIRERYWGVCTHSVTLGSVLGNKVSVLSWLCTILLGYVLTGAEPVATTVH